MRRYRVELISNDPARRGWVGYSFATYVVRANDPDDAVEIALKTWGRLRSHAWACRAYATP